MKSYKRLLSTAVATAVAASGLMLASTGAASAATGNSLRIAPVSGDTTTPLSMSTLPGVKCTNADSYGIDIVVTGPAGSPLNTGDNVLLGTTDYGLVQGPNNNLAYPAMARKWGEIFSANGMTNVSGAYTVTLECIASDAATVTDTFTQTVNFTAVNATTSTYQMVVPAQSTTTTVSGPSTVGYGSSVTLTGTVAPNPGSGTVTFKEGGSTLGTGTVNASGVASFATPTTLGAGTHSIVAAFGGASGFNASADSAPFTLTVSKVTPSITASSNGPVAQYQVASFSATVTPAVAGTVNFIENGSTIASGSVNTGTGVATASSTSLAQGSHTITAQFVPSNPANVNGATSAPFTQQIDAPLGASALQPIDVVITPGYLTISLLGQTADPATGAVSGSADVIHMGAPVFQPDGAWLRSAGALHAVTITDTRAGNPGWAATGVVSSFSDGSGHSISGYNLGWTPHRIDQAASQNVTAAAQAVAEKVVTGGTGVGTGLGSTQPFASAPDNFGNGTVHLDGALDLWIPTDVPAGTYNATLTFTVS
jgi:hypothetical protein